MKITVERSLSNLCGYCLCDKELLPAPQQTHKILKNRVYDLTVRKRFCSDRCFTISCKIAEQIPSTPLWLRVHENMTEIDVACGHETSRSGDEITIPPHISRSEYVGLDDKVERDWPTDDIECMGMLDNEPSSLCAAAKSVVTPRHAILNLGISEKRVCAETLLDEVRNILRQWITRSTAELLFGCRDNTVPKADVTVHIGGTDMSRSTPLFSSNPQVNSKPSVQTKLLNHGLRHDIPVKDYEDKVSYFLAGGPASPVHGREVTEDQEQGRISTMYARVSEAQYVRENIVMKRVQMLLDDLSPPLPNLIPELRAFVKSLNLTRLNVMACVELWPVLTISILFLLSLKNVALENILKSEELSRVLQKILCVCGMSMSSLKQIVLGIPVLQKFLH